MQVWVLRTGTSYTYIPIQCECVCVSSRRHGQHFFFFLDTLLFLFKQGGDLHPYSALNSMSHTWLLYWVSVVAHSVHPKCMCPLGQHVLTTISNPIGIGLVCCVANVLGTEGLWRLAMVCVCVYVWKSVQSHHNRIIGGMATNANWLRLAKLKCLARLFASRCCDDLVIFWHAHTHVVDYTYAQTHTHTFKASTRMRRVQLIYKRSHCCCGSNRSQSERYKSPWLFGDLWECVLCYLCVAGSNGSAESHGLVVWGMGIRKALRHKRWGTGYGIVCFSFLFICELAPRAACEIIVCYHQLLFCKHDRGALRMNSR